MRWRTSATIILGTIWLVFILIWAAFYAWQFSLFQNIVIFFASIIVTLGAIAAIWAAWGMRWMDRGTGPWR